MIAIVDYGVGNLYSLQCSIRHIGEECAVTANPKELEAADGIILPGVGAFGDAIAKLRKNGLDQVVYKLAKSGKPLFGICLGMQLLYEASNEYGFHAGLGLVHGQVLSLEKALGSVNEKLKVPHMGWNDLVFHGESPLLKYSKEGEFVYYVHSFYAMVTGETVAFSRYGSVELTGAVQCGNVYGTQFHPEKSGGVGLNMLRAFADICKEGR
jgi:glutamine amidotransferase